MIQEREGILMILDPRQELIPLVGAVHGQTKDCMKAWNSWRLLSHLVLTEGNDQFHGLLNVIGLVGGTSGAPECCREFSVGPGNGCIRDCSRAIEPQSVENA